MREGEGFLKRLLRLKDAAPKAPEPLRFKDERLHFVPSSPQLSAYDALLLDARHDDEPSRMTSLSQLTSPTTDKPEPQSPHDHRSPKHDHC